MRIIGDTKFFTTAEVAQQLGVGEHTVRFYIRQGTIQASKVGRSYWVTEATLREYVKNKYQIEL